jgi:hypothetical protein
MKKRLCNRCRKKKREELKLPSNRSNKKRERKKMRRRRERRWNLMQWTRRRGLKKCLERSKRKFRSSK